MDSATAESAETAGGALAGLRVVELANFISGPLIGMMLADHGAEVIKIEQPLTGDGIRTWGNRKDGIGLFHKVLNRNKRSVTADLNSALGREIVQRLAKTADVVIENFRPGTLEKWGLGYDVLQRDNPGLVLVRVSGFGQTGPYRSRSGFGSMAEAMTGFAYTNGYPDRPPLLPGFALADAVTGLGGAFLALAAREADRKRGQIVDLAIYEPLLTLMGTQLIEFDQLGILQERAGSRLPLVSPRSTFRTRDGKWIAVSAGAAAVFRRLCVALGVPELAEDERFSDNQKRLENANAIEAALQAAIGSMNQEEIVRRLEEHDAPGAPVYSVAEIFEDPHFLARQNIVMVRDDELGGDVRMQNVMGRLSGSPGAVRHAAQPLGGSNREVLMEELGFDETELRNAGLTV